LRAAVFALLEAVLLLGVLREVVLLRRGILHHPEILREVVLLRRGILRHPEILLLREFHRLRGFLFLGLVAGDRGVDIPLLH